MNNMSNKSMIRLSKLISLVLRHDPDHVGVSMDSHGWVDTSELIKGIRKAGYEINYSTLVHIVENDDKNRYSFSKFNSKIRANQGHSIPVDLDLEPVEPPHYLYHGTTSRFLDSISKNGIRPMNRMYVHLSKDVETALEVGRRHGKPVVLMIDARRMNREGVLFYRSENGVWLTDFVDSKYIAAVRS